jgi:peptidylprolyl isomerase
MTTLTPWARRVAVPVLTAVLLAAGCGSSSDSGTVVKDASPRCAKVKKLAPATGKPTTVEVPPRPATTLVQQDLKVGTGEAAVDGKQLTVDFVGISCTSGEEFDASWGKGEPDPKTKKPGDKPLEFVLGKGEVIKGWDQGLQGMKVGGRRRLVIPADLAYGPTGQPPSIAPNDTLVFIVDLTKVANPPPTTTAPPTTVAPSTTAPPSTAAPPPTTAAPSTTAPGASTTAPSTSR